MIGNSNEAKDIGRFIRARREASIASDYAYLPSRRRHVPHLTQSDLAELLQISVVVISQIEQGRYPNLNQALLNKIAHVLKFTPQHEIYLLGLLVPRPSEQISTEPPPAWVITSIESVSHPALVVNPAYDVLWRNSRAAQLFGEYGADFAPNTNSAVSIFQVRGVREFIVDWPAYATSSVSGLKMSYAMAPNFRDRIDKLVHQLMDSDSLFAELWVKDDPLVKPTIEKQFNHPKVGLMNVLQILTDIVEAPGLTRIEFLPADDDAREKFARM